MSSSSFWTKPLGIAVMVLGLCGVVMIGMVSIPLSTTSKQARKELLGTWREANVASYSANRIKVANEACIGMATLSVPIFLLTVRRSNSNMVTKDKSITLIA